MVGQILTPTSAVQKQLENYQPVIWGLFVICVTVAPGNPNTEPKDSPCSKEFSLRLEIKSGYRQGSTRKSETLLVSVIRRLSTPGA